MSLNKQQVATRRDLYRQKLLALSSKSPKLSLIKRQLATLNNLSAHKL